MFFKIRTRMESEFMDALNSMQNGNGRGTLEKGI